MSRKRDHVREAAEALSDLNTFASIVSILEGGHIHTRSYRAGAKIIALCKREQGKRLDDLDAAIAKFQVPA